MELNQKLTSTYQAFQSNKMKSEANSAKGANQIGTAARAEEKLGEFQGLLVNMMLSSMRATIPKNELTNGGQGEEIFQQMLDTEYSKKSGSSDMLQLNTSLKRSFKLPLSETFNWSQLEKVDEKRLRTIHNEIGTYDPSTLIGSSKNEPIASKATKQLDRIVKSKKLLEKLPEEKRNSLDSSFLKQWKTKRDDYIENKGPGGSYGPKLWEMNKELMEELYPEIKMKNNIINYKKISKAYGATAEIK
ncbi:MAG: hypothetical protein COA79_09705 [Planctomycetota bacterium]|nr:MAG: hypothetical protein COA79_09705 [Planctomycetota bacterium]